MVNIFTLGDAGHGKTTLTAAIMYCLGNEYASLQSVPGAGDPDVAGVSREAYATAAHQYSHSDGPASSLAAMLASPPKQDVGIVVIAADFGPTKGTKDALQAAQSAGVDAIIGFVSKTDVVADPELVELVELEIGELLGSYKFSKTNIVSGSANDALNSAGTRNDKKAACIFTLVDAVDKAVPANVS